ncbi:DAK2 domain-containing protein [Mycolicibacillus trivialis]
MAERVLDAVTLRDWAHTAVGDLITHTDEINRINVFPIADSDTGTNMLFTMRSALAEANTAAGSGELTRVATALSVGALHGARGNSGVILSQILRGLADVLSEADPAPAVVGPDLLGAALQRGVELSIASMGGREVPGTIVSVLAAAAAAVRRAGSGLAAALGAAGDAAAIALDETTGQLDALAEAGVVDAGGRGLLVLLDALTATVTGRVPDRPAYRPAPPPQTEPEVAPPGPQFEVMYLLHDTDAAGVTALRRRLGRLGESVAIAAGADGHSVHVHTDDAGAAVEAGLAAGRLSGIHISGLVTRRPQGSWARERAVLAVVDGAGAAELFGGEGACILPVEQAEPISAAQLLRAMVDTGAAQVLVLPNGHLPAEELVAGCTAATGWGIDVVPLPTASMVQGLAALAVHDPARQIVDDGFTMTRAAAATRYGSVALASEAALTWAGPCDPGDGLGIAGGEVLIVGPDVATAATGLIDLLLAAGGELVTVLIGAAVGDGAAAVEATLKAHVHDAHPGIELAVYRTGHGGDALLIGVE